MMEEMRFSSGFGHCTLNRSVYWAGHFLRHTGENCRAKCTSGAAFQYEMTLMLPLQTLQSRFETENHTAGYKHYAVGFTEPVWHNNDHMRAVFTGVMLPDWSGFFQTGQNVWSMSNPAPYRNTLH